MNDQGLGKALNVAAEHREQIRETLRTGLVDGGSLGVIGQALAMGAVPETLRLARTEMQRAHQRAWIDVGMPGADPGEGAHPAGEDG